MLEQALIDRLILRAAKMLELYQTEDQILEAFVKEGFPVEASINAIRAGSILIDHREPVTQR